MSVTLQVRGDTAAAWVTANPVLHQREIGLETDTGKAKAGDGATTWTALGYWAPAGPSLPGLAQASVSAAGALAVNTLTEVSAASSPLTMTLPTPVTGQLITAEKSDSTANTVTVSGSIRGSAGNLVLRLQYESITFFAYSGTWFLLAGHKTLSSLDARYSERTGVPWVTVSPVGIAGGAAVANNGADYGPDTPGTITSGILEAVSYAVAQAQGSAAASPEVLLMGGKFSLTQFANTTYRIAIPIDSGHAVSAGPPVSLTIRGAGDTMNGAEGTAFGQAYSQGSTVLDASALDVLAQGTYAQGRVLGVVPRQTSGTGFVSTHPLNAVNLRTEDLTVIVPVYNAAGTGGPAYTLSGVSSKLFINGNSQSANTTHWEFVNGIDAWAASSFKCRNITVMSALAAFNPNGNQYAGGGGVFAYGSAAGIVWPEDANQGNCHFECVATYDLHTSMMISTHVSGDQLYSQASQHVLYYRSSGHGARIGRMNPQSCNELIRHLLMPQLTNSLSGAFFDPVGDLYAGVGMTFPTAASPSLLIIGEAAIEASMNTFLKDDTSNPLTVIANVDYTGSIPAANWGAGANLVINWIDVAGHAQTVLSGTTAGTATWTQGGTSPWDKRVIVYLAGYENTTGTAQAITFRNAFNNPPAITKDATGGATVSATTLTLPASMGSPVTGYIILEGY